MQYGYGKGNREKKRRAFNWISSTEYKNKLEMVYGEPLSKAKL